MNKNAIAFGARVKIKQGMFVEAKLRQYAFQPGSNGSFHKKDCI